VRGHESESKRLMSRDQGLLSNHECGEHEVKHSKVKIVIGLLMNEL
jgi:hypothetical protein